MRAHIFSKGVERCEKNLFRGISKTWILFTHSPILETSKNLEKKLAKEEDLGIGAALLQPSFIIFGVEVGHIHSHG